MDENQQIHFDYNALSKQFAEKVIVDFMSALMPDEKTRKLFVGMMSVHRKYGIDPVTSMKILQDYAKFMTNNEE